MAVRESLALQLLQPLLPHESRVKKPKSLNLLLHEEVGPEGEAMQLPLLRADLRRAIHSSCLWLNEWLLEGESSRLANEDLDLVAQGIPSLGLPQQLGRQNQLLHAIRVLPRLRAAIQIENQALLLKTMTISHLQPPHQAHEALLPQGQGVTLAVQQLLG